MSKSDVRVNQVFTLLNGSDATRANGCHFFTLLELDMFRNSMLKALVDKFPKQKFFEEPILVNQKSDLPFLRLQRRWKALKIDVLQVQNH